jgi:hypothetical protein
MHRGQLIAGVLLLVFGGFMLADAMGIRLPNGSTLSDLFWPMALLLAGAWILWGVFLRGSVEMESASIDLQGATSARLKINHAAGELKLHGGAAANEVVHGMFSGGLQQKATRNGDRLEVRMWPAKDILDFPFFGSHSQIDWDVALNAAIPLELHLDLGANKSILDLHDLNVTKLDLDSGASDTRLTLPAKGRFRADLDLGATSMEVTLPEGLSARIHASVAAGDIQVDEIRFPRNGKYYQSAEYETAVNAVDLTIDAGAASVKIK